MIKPISLKAVLGEESYWQPNFGEYHLGGTGTRKVHDDLRNATKMWIKERMEFIHPTGVVTGGCTGFDALMGEYCALRWEDLVHVVVVPADQKAVDPWWTKPTLSHVDITVVQMPEGSTYRDRNIEIIRRSHTMLGQPERPEADEKSRRSGTWQTIRLARKAGLGVDLALTDWLREQDQRHRPSTTPDLGK